MTCPRCGNENPAGARFCNNCGAPLAESREERRLATVLFADVAASTELATQLDPEALRRLLGRFYELARVAVGAHGGTLEKFIGDAAMAVFGLPQAHDDDAERAVRTAFALREAVAADPALAGKVAIRCGVNTGEVVGAVGATGDHIVTGEAVHLAARLQQSGDTGAILVGDRTARATEGRIRYDGPLALRVKGKAEALVAWRALEAREAGVRPLRTRTALLGRDDDLALLHVVTRRAIGERRVHIVTVSAPAGIGKSRLISEFLAALETAPHPPRIGRTLCLPYGTSLAYGAMRGALRTLAGEIERAEPFLVELGLDERGRHAILVAAGLRGEGAMSIPRDELARAWRDMLRALAGDRPLVIFCDDLHWASDSLIALIEDVVRLPLEAPIVLLFATRPDLFEHHPNWPAAKRDATALQLRPLPDADIARLVAELGGGALSRQTRERIVKRAEGNAFFAEEIVRAALVEEDVDAALPDSVQAAILARLDQLPEAERRVVQAAAVAGRPFTSAHIQAIEPALSTEQIAASLTSLAERELIEPLDATRSLFRHLLIRDVAIGTLPRRERADAHVRLADWLTEQGDGESVELAAVHLDEAWSLRETLGLPPDDALRARTIAALTRAADRAFALYATLLARQRLERALALATDDTTRLPLLEKLGDVIARETPSETSAEKYREALGIWTEVAGDHLTGARLHRKLALLMARWPGAFRRWPTQEEVDVEAELAIRLAADDRHERGLALLALCGLRTGEVAPEKRLRLLGEAKTLLADFEDPDIEGLIGDATTIALWGSGDYEGFFAEAKRLVARSARFGIQERVEALRRLAVAAMFTWQVDDMRDATLRALELCEGGEVGHTYLHALQSRIYFAAVLDDWDDVVAFGERLRSEWVRQGERGAACNSSASAILATVLHRRGAPGAASEFDLVLDALRESPAPTGRIRLDFWILRRAWLGDRPVDVEELVRRYEGQAPTEEEHVDPFDFATLVETVAMFGAAEAAARLLSDPPRYQAPPIAAMLRRAEGRIALARGDAATARSALDTATRAFRELGLRWEAATSASLLARVAPRDEAEALRAEARATFSALGDKPSLAELDAVAAR